MPGPFCHVSETNVQQIHSWLKLFLFIRFTIFQDKSRLSLKQKHSI